MAIILPHTTADIPFFRSNGVCYQRTQQGVDLIPDHTWDEMVIPQDFGISDSCVNCNNWLLTPYAFPCSYSTSTAVDEYSVPSCGDPLDPIYRDYIVHISNVEFGAGTPYYTAMDDPVWGGECYGGNVRGGTWTASGGGVRIAGTTISRYVSHNQGGGYTGSLVWDKSLRLWVFYFRSGWVGTTPTASFGTWTKNYGNSPDGVYTMLPFGTNLLNNTYRGDAISPSSILVEHVEP